MNVLIHNPLYNNTINISVHKPLYNNTINIFSLHATPKIYNGVPLRALEHFSCVLPENTPPRNLEISLFSKTQIVGKEVTYTN